MFDSTEGTGVRSVAAVRDASRDVEFREGSRVRHELRPSVTVLPERRSRRPIGDEDAENVTLLGPQMAEIEGLKRAA
jgi:hypothetical protein